MKNLLLLICILFSFVGQAQKTPFEKDIAYDQYKYEKHLKKADNSYDTVVGGLIITTLGVVGRSAVKWNPNYRSKEIKALSNGLTLIGSSMVVIGTYNFFDNKRSARKIEKKYNF
jgi:hypothetical protein